MTDYREVGRADGREPPPTGDGAGVGDGDGDGESPPVYTISPDERPSTTVVEAVATTIDRPATSLEPLARSVDPEALDRLIDRVGDRSIEVTFGYEGTTVTVRSTGEVVVRQ